MSNISNVNSQNNNYWIPKEIPMAASGVALAASANVGMQFIGSDVVNWTKVPSILRNFLGYSCAAISVVGGVMAVYSSIRLCQKIISEKNELNKAMTATALGSLATALVQAIGEHFYDIAPFFDYLGKHSLAFCIGTNLAWQASFILGVAGIVFTAYAAYRTGQAILANMNPLPVNTQTEKV